MALVLFYHVTRSTVPDTVELLLNRALGQGWRVMLRSPDPARIEWYDQKLWLGPEDGFLPHGIEGGPHDADQPVLIGAGPICNAARALLLLDGAEPLPGEAQALDRVWLLFDGNDEAAVNIARGQWKRITAEGLHAQYWSEETGRWQMKTEKVPGA